MILVDNTRLIINGRDYSIKNLISAVSEQVPKKYMVEKIIFAAGMVLILLKIAWGVLFIIGSFVISSIRKDKFSVRINSDAGEIEVFRSPDEEYVNKIVTAINESISYRA